MLARVTAWVLQVELCGGFWMVGAGVLYWGLVCWTVGVLVLASIGFSCESVGLIVVK